MDSEFITLKEVAEMLRISPISVHRLVARRDVPVYRFNRHYRFRKREILAFIERHKTPDLDELPGNPRYTRRKPLI